MSKKTKIPRLSGIKTRIVYRDSMRRFATRDNSVSEETWKYRVDKKNKIHDLKIEALPYYYGEVSWYPSIKIPEKGQRSGKLSAALRKTLQEIGYTRYDTKMEITMEAKTYHGKKVTRKLTFYHYNTRKLEEHTIGGIINALFYEYGDRRAYSVKIVKGWRKRETTKKETEKRRQLYDVTFHIRTDAESRKAKKPKRRKSRRELYDQE